MWVRCCCGGGGVVLGVDVEPELFGAAEPEVFCVGWGAGV